jgi:hypothetical protein
LGFYPHRPNAYDLAMTLRQNLLILNKEIYL